MRSFLCVIFIILDVYVFCVCVLCDSIYFVLKDIHYRGHPMKDMSYDNSKIFLKVPVFITTQRTIHPKRQNSSVSRQWMKILLFYFRGHNYIIM